MSPLRRELYSPTLWLRVPVLALCAPPLQQGRPDFLSHRRFNRRLVVAHELIAKTLPCALFHGVSSSDASIVIAIRLEQTINRRREVLFEGLHRQ